MEWASDSTGVETPANTVKATHTAMAAAVARGTRSRAVEGARRATAVAVAPRPAVANASRSPATSASPLGAPGRGGGGGYVHQKGHPQVGEGGYGCTHHADEGELVLALADHGGDHQPLAQKAARQGYARLGQQEHEHAPSQPWVALAQAPDAAEVVAHLATALGEADHGKGPDDHEQVGEEVKGGRRPAGLGAGLEPYQHVARLADAGVGK